MVKQGVLGRCGEAEAEAGSDGVSEGVSDADSEGVAGDGGCGSEVHCGVYTRLRGRCGQAR